MPEAVDISVVMVGLNTRDFVRNALASLRQSDWGGFTYELIYVDNNSQDDSVEMVRQEFPEVEVIANSTNRHYCPAANQASAIARGRFLLHLNNDVLVERNAVAQTAEFLDSDPSVTAVGCRLLNPDGTDQWSARRFPAWYNGLLGRRSLLSKVFPTFWIVRRYLFKDELQGDTPFRVDWTGTVFMLVRKEAFEAVGSFPEGYYYWHESMFCHRLEKQGGQTWIVPNAKVVHFEGSGGGPRSYAVRRWHIIDFSRGAYRFHCERHSLNRLNPLRWFAAASLVARAGVLLFINWLRSLSNKQHA